MHENIAQYLAHSKSSVNGSFCHFVVIVGMIFGISSFLLLVESYHPLLTRSSPVGISSAYCNGSLFLTMETVYKMKFYVGH